MTRLPEALARLNLRHQGQVAKNRDFTKVIWKQTCEVLKMCICILHIYIQSMYMYRYIYISIYIHISINLPPRRTLQKWNSDKTISLMMEFQQFPASENLWKSNKNFLTTNHPALKGFCTNDTAWSQVGMSSLYWVSAWCLFGLPQWCLKPEASWHEHLSFCLVTRVFQARTNCFYIIWSKLAVALLHGIWSCDARYCQTHFSCPNSALAIASLTNYSREMQQTGRAILAKNISPKFCRTQLPQQALFHCPNTIAVIHKIPPFGSILSKAPWIKTLVFILPKHSWYKWMFLNLIYPPKETNKVLSYIYHQSYKST